MVIISADTLVTDLSSWCALQAMQTVCAKAKCKHTVAGKQLAEA